MAFIRKRGLSLFLSLSLLFSSLWALTVPARAASAPVQAQLPILIYHNLTADTARENNVTLSVQTFAADLQWLKSHGYETVSLSQVLDFAYNGVALPEKPVMITFDDSFESFLLLAYPLLEQYQMKAVVNVLGWPAEELGDSDNHGLPYSAMNWAQIQSIAGSDLVEFESHTYDLHSQDKGRTGCQIKQGEDTQSYQTLLYNDLNKLQEYLRIYAGAAPLAFAYPYGATCPEALPVLKELGFKAAFTCDSHINALTAGDTELLYALGRFNRPTGPNSETFLGQTMKLS